MDMDCAEGGLPSPVGPLQQNQPDLDVFLEAVHCQEAQCPLHQGSGEVKGLGSGSRDSMSGIELSGHVH